MDHPHYLPTPAEIESAAREVQATWDEGTEQARRGGTRERYEIPVVHVDGVEFAGPEVTMPFSEGRREVKRGKARSKKC